MKRTGTEDDYIQLSTNMNKFNKLVRKIRGVSSNVKADSIFILSSPLTLLNKYTRLFTILGMKSAFTKDPGFNRARQIIALLIRKIGQNVEVPKQWTLFKSKNKNKDEEQLEDKRERGGSFSKSRLRLFSK
ncbi:hypothetical protein EIN_278540 [Entamoeba invadens IP1]|uniref:Uncharacterized protein n=1 Tax=Entamoeba invadens IP1 TaxID=370355 RepID=A0A0A1TVE1_ENTIV|nr:hypothetical protein EIN_278540 [Entamoeba invadens IP1]ELP84354.1 hypothetical protein EIN_278540 [Entamoeba invadens IP1]|eukprot:XP_004183700.1 hypothetical protein EIN_278540 [Entamoeba invadens IP1]